MLVLLASDTSQLKVSRVSSLFIVSMVGARFTRNGFGIPVLCWKTPSKRSYLSQRMELYNQELMA